MATKEHNVFTYLLERLGVNYTRTFALTHYEEHPHKNNLYGLSRMLFDYGVENVSYRLEKEVSVLNELETPFVAHIGNDFGIVDKITPESVHYFWRQKSLSVSPEQFLSMWSGVVMLAEADLDAGEPGYALNKRKEVQKVASYGLTGVCLLLLLVLAVVNIGIYASFGSIALLVANIAGIAVCYLLLSKQLGIDSQYSDKICSVFSQTDCNQVLDSDASKLGNTGYSWSEIGLAWFISNLILILFAPQLIVYQAVINCMALPYSVWSVWYQKAKAKEWCPLCLMVQLLIWILFFIHLVTGIIRLPDFQIQDILLTGVIYLLPILIVHFLSDIFVSAGKLSEVTQEMNSLKANEDVFLSLLKKQAYHTVFEADSRIVFGDADAVNCLTVLTNPHCNPCASMHKKIERLMKDTNDKIKVQYIFTSFNEELTASSRFLIAVYQAHDPEQTKEIYTRWFEGGKNSREDFYKEFPVYQEEAEIADELKKHEAWKERSGIAGTPTVLFNGYQLPSNYKVEDIKHFIHIRTD